MSCFECGRFCPYFFTLVHRLQLRMELRTMRRVNWKQNITLRITMISNIKIYFDKKIRMRKWVCKNTNKLFVKSRSKNWNKLFVKSACMNRNELFVKSACKNRNKLLVKSACKNRNKFRNKYFYFLMNNFKS